jgi:hypothetical protein
MPITEENRREFEQLGTDQLSKRVERSVYDENKLRQARDWLNENNPSWISAREAQRAGIKATIALVISGLALLVSIAGLWKSY